MLTAPQFFSLAMAVLLTGAILTSCDSNPRKDHLRGEHRKDPAGFTKKWGTGPGTDKPMPGRDRKW